MPHVRRRRDEETKSFSATKVAKCNDFSTLENAFDNDDTCDTPTTATMELLKTLGVNKATRRNLALGNDGGGSFVGDDKLSILTVPVPPRKKQKASEDDVKDEDEDEGKKEAAEKAEEEKDEDKKSAVAVKKKSADKKSAVKKPAAGLKKKPAAAATKTSPASTEVDDNVDIKLHATDKSFEYSSLHAIKKSQKDFDKGIEGTPDDMETLSEKLLKLQDDLTTEKKEHNFGTQKTIHEIYEVAGLLGNMMEIQSMVGQKPASDQSAWVRKARA